MGIQEMSDNRRNIMMWILFLCLPFISGSPQLRYHFQHFNGAEFQGAQSPSSPLQFLPTNANSFQKQQQSVGYLRRRAPYANPVQYQYGRGYISYPCQNLVLHRLRYRPCQYQQAYSRRRNTFPGDKFQMNLAPARNYARTGRYQAKWQQKYQPRQTYYHPMPEVGAGYLEDYPPNALVPDQYFLTQEGLWKPQGRSPVTHASFKRPELHRSEVEVKRQSAEAGEERQKEEVERALRLETDNEKRNQRKEEEAEEQRRQSEIEAGERIRKEKEEQLRREAERQRQHLEEQKKLEEQRKLEEEKERKKKLEEEKQKVEEEKKRK